MNKNSRGTMEEKNNLKMGRLLFMQKSFLMRRNEGG